MIKKILSMIVVFFICCTVFSGCEASAKKEKQDVIREISFSPDGKKLIFDRRNAGRPGMIHVYDLTTGDLSAYQPPQGERWFHARYSFDGKQIVFIKMPLTNGKDNPENTQIAVMDSEGKNVREITNTRGFKVYPSFSHSGKKIIFARPDMLREKGSRTPAADYDVYEVDVETGQETRLTHFIFYEMSRPYYFPDDKTFVFWGDFPRAYPAIPGSDKNIDIMQKVRKDLRAKYQNNSIYVMQANASELKPYLVMPEYQKKFKMYVAGSEDSRGPTLNADGSVLIFDSIGYKPDGLAEGWQTYQYSADGNHRQITHLPLTSIWSKAISPNGEFIAIIYGDMTTNKIVLYKVKDGKSKEIILPDQPSRIINAQ